MDNSIIITLAIEAGAIIVTIAVFMSKIMAKIDRLITSMEKTQEDTHKEFDTIKEKVGEISTAQKVGAVVVEQIQKLSEGILRRITNGANR